MGYIQTAYEVITPETARGGDVEERGWEDEEGIEVNVEEAIEYLRDRGPLECHDYGRYLSCRTLDPERDIDDYDTEKYYEYFIKGFGPKAKEKIFDAVDFGVKLRR